MDMIRAADRESLTTLLGVILIKIATGIVSTWGSSNIYFLSYLRQQGYPIDGSTNSTLMLAALIPAGLLALTATRLMRVLGSRRVIIGCGCIFLISPLTLNLSFTIYTMGIFLMFLPTLSFAISSIAVINCLWSQFQKNRNKATGVALFFFSIGGILWNVIFMAILNPNNIKSDSDSSANAYFHQDVTSNIFRGINTIYISAGSFFVIGAFLVSKRLPALLIEENNKDIQNKKYIHSDGANTQEIIKQENNAVINGKQFDNKVIADSKIQPNGSKSQGSDENFPIEKNSFQKSNSEKSASNQEQVNQGQINQGQVNQRQVNQEQINQRQVKIDPPPIQTLWLSLMDRRFKMIFVCSMLMAIYPIYLGTNIKLIYMPIINDDHFIGLCMVANTVSSTIGAPVWGYLADSKGFKKAFLIIALVDVIIKLFGLLADSKATLLIMFICLGFIDKGLITVGGPGLVDMFGLDMATEMLPYKGLSLFMAFVLVPIVQLLFISMLSNHNLLIIYFCISFSASIIGVYFYRTVKQ